MSANLELRRNVIPMRPVSRMPGGMFDAPKFAGVTFTATGLIIKRGMKVEQWIELGIYLRSLKDCLQLWVGDWVNYGQRAYVYGHKYDEAVALTGYTKGTLYNCVWVAKAVPFSLRDEKLVFQHYRAVAILPTKRQIKKWVGLAVKGDRKKPWSAARLGREIIKASKPPAPVDTAPLTKLHESLVRQELDSRIAEVRAWKLATVDPRLTVLYDRLIESLEWQRDRTERTDCAAIMQIFTGDEGTEGPERATDGDIPAWLYGHGFIMTKAEIGHGGCHGGCSLEHPHIQKSGRLGLMVRLKMLSVETREGSRHKDQPGVITSVYKPERDYLSFLVDDIPELDAADREPALLRDWAARLKRYAPELAAGKVNPETRLP